MKTTIKFFAVVIACVFFTSCEQENVQPESIMIQKESPLNGSGVVDKVDQTEKEKLDSFQETMQ